MFRIQAQFVALTGLLTMAVTSPAVAAPDVPACIEAHADGQELRSQQMLVQAREKFLTCSADGCPDLVRKDCTQFLTEVGASTPTLVLAAVEDGQRDLTSVTVELDGRPLASALDGSAVAVNPGEHRITFRAPGGRVREYRIVARENEKGRRVVAQFESSPDSAETGASSGAPPTLAYVLGGAGVLALGSFAYFGLRGRSTEECAPDCTRSEVDRMRTQYLVADISLGLGIASLGAATYVFFAHRSRRSEAPRTARVQVRPPRVGQGVGIEARLDF